MGDYHTVYKGPEGETTQWEDIQTRLGNLPPKPKPWRPDAYAPPADEGAARQRDVGSLAKRDEQELAELAAGGTQGDWGAHRDTDGEEPARAALDAEYRRKAQLLLEAEAPGHARRKRHAKKRAHPEHVAPRAHRSEEPVASAVRRAEICAELHAAGQSRSAGKSSAKARARARRDGTGNVGNASS